MRTLLFGALTLTAQAAFAGPPELFLPVDCTLGKDCYIQNYVDADPSPKRADFTCGKLVYDGHKGTDFAVPSHLDALAGVAVLAAASGQVKALRDGVADQFLGANADFPEGQDCGNGVLLTHADGWETQYCHLQNGSIAVQPGDRVQSGTVLGRIGMSGRTEFPHLHLSLRHDGKVVDPFAPTPKTTCDDSAPDQLWAEPIAYDPGGVLQAGFAPDVPKFDTIKHGRAHHQRISTPQGALVIWAHTFGTRPGDQLRLHIDGPSGWVYEHVEPMDKDHAQAMRAAGRKLTPGSAPPGDYTGTVTLIRDGAEIDRMTVITTLTD